ncbi:hypothetical protein PoB_004923900 [Plakobranchus ocellatus]|uniref:Uncharacterized protein n=1 Tax=Plakobranchus ocellatus TaxID=259542 RepID=A0AAV4BVA4_9GAST|nr:hypothetical protein PoB_004923900 [Plakobranchus ocellatus]
MHGALTVIPNKCQPLSNQVNDMGAVILSSHWSILGVGSGHVTISTVSYDACPWCQYGLMPMPATVGSRYSLCYSGFTPPQALGYNAEN